MPVLSRMEPRLNGLMCIGRVSHSSIIECKVVSASFETHGIGAISVGNENTRNGHVRTAALAATPPMRVPRNPRLFIMETKYHTFSRVSS